MSENDNHADLLNKLRELNIYELERLRDCFKYELSIEPENRDSILDILKHIDMVLDEIVQGMKEN